MHGSLLYFIIVEQEGNIVCSINTSVLRTILCFNACQCVVGDPSIYPLISKETMCTQFSKFFLESFSSSGVATEPISSFTNQIKCPLAAFILDNCSGCILAGSNTYFFTGSKCVVCHFFTVIRHCICDLCGKFNLDILIFRYSTIECDANKLTVTGITC